VFGDVFIAASSTIYYGPFTGIYRDELVQNWLAKCHEVGIECSEKYNLQTVLSDAVTVREFFIDFITHFFFFFQK